MTWSTALFLLAIVVLIASMQRMAAQQQAERGRVVFSEYCQRCHGDQGQGPSSIRTKAIWKQPVDSLIKVVTYGARGHMTMSNGTRRSMVASPYSDSDIAQVSAYAMKLIGGRDVVVATQDVQRVRKQHTANVKQKVKKNR